jgi:chromosome segregation protein
LLDSDREKEIISNSSTNEKRLLEEKNQLFDLEQKSYEIEKKSTDDYQEALSKLNKVKESLKTFFEKIIEYLNFKKDVDEKSLRDELSDHMKNLDEHQDKYASRYGKYDLVKQEIAKRRERLESIEKEIKNWKELKDNSTKKLEELQLKLKNLEQDLEVEENKPRNFAEKRGSISQNIENYKSTEESLNNELQDKENKINDLNESLLKNNQSILDKNGNKVRFQTIIEGLNKNLKDLKQKSFLDFNLDLESIKGFCRIDSIDDLSVDSAQSHLTQLKNKRDSMGAVNLRADTETTDLKNKINQMMENRKDIVHGISKLKSAINDLNQKGRERLLDAFEKVNRKFNDVYTKLFLGGNARLELIESDDPLEAGLELLVSPPGKKLQSITLLSGGEQALTALALIFAVFLINPAPICILDEVDAPLDDANVTRFNGLLDELSKITETKFLVITHHALTMSRMNRLYGVTMAERGVSQLVAVNLDKAEELVA